MLKQRIQLEDDFIQRKSERRDAGQPDLNDTENCRERHFAEMEAKRRGNVEIRIDVMNVMKAPQEADLVIRHVPVIKRKVHQYESDRHLRRFWKRKPLQDTDSLN